MAVSAPARVDRTRLENLITVEEKRLNDRTPNSGVMYARACQSMTGGVPSSYQNRSPWPIYIDSGEGSHIRDVDGNEYIDFHNGFGSMVQGHAHPAIVRAVSDRVTRGTHFAAPVEDAIVVSEHLASRFRLPLWRYVNSGSEATMDAIRIARGLTGRDTIVKIFGSYHGHHDYVMVSTGNVPIELMGEREHLNSVPYGGGIPQAATDLTIPVPFNDAPAMERRIEELIAEGRKPACVIMEAAMMNLGVVLPLPGYLEAVRDLTRKHGIVLIFDEVKTGLTVAPGGATDKFGVVPDMVTLAKAVGGGLPAGAIGGTEEVMSVVLSGGVKQVGTYNGNPLVMAAARATLEEVLTPAAYEHLNMLNDRMLAGCASVLDRYGLTGYTVGISSKGAVIFSPVTLTDYESFVTQQDARINHLAWLYAMNRGIYMTPGREEEWTLSVQHTVGDADRYIAQFEEMAHDLIA